MDSGRGIGTTSRIRAGTLLKVSLLSNPVSIGYNNRPDPNLHKDGDLNIIDKYGGQGEIEWPKLQSMSALVLQPEESRLRAGPAMSTFEQLII